MQLPAFAGIALSPKARAESLLMGGFRSHWKAADRLKTELWIMSLPDGSLELRGRDAHTIWEGLIVADSKAETTICVGTGFRFEDGVPFAYRATLSLFESDEGTRLLEEWNVTFRDGHTIMGQSTLDAVPSSAEER